MVRFFGILWDPWGFLGIFGDSVGILRRSFGIFGDSVGLNGILGDFWVFCWDSVKILWDSWGCFRDFEGFCWEFERSFGILGDSVGFH